MSRRKRLLQFYSGIGGQAVLEGVMMRNKENFAVAVRLEDGSVTVDHDVYHGVLDGTIFKKLPFVRGFFVFIDSLMLGMKALNHSTRHFVEETEEETGMDKALDKVSGGHGERIIMAFTTAISFALAIGIFMILPFFIARLFRTFVRSAMLMSIIEGVTRILIFVIYILLISQLKDIKRLFRYHGAEHKCINCIESGRDLTVQNVRASSKLHKRCGSSFMLYVMVVSIVLFFFIRTESVLMRIAWRLILIPVISGISYEIISLAGKSDNFLVRIFSAPGFWMQGLTTKEPSRDMIEVGIASVEAVFDWRAFQREKFGKFMEAEAEEVVMEETAQDNVEEMAPEVDVPEQIYVAPDEDGVIQM